MKNQVKLARAITAAKMLPMATQHILGNIPESVINALTSAQLTELIQAMNKQFMDGKKEEIKELNNFIGLPNDVSIWDVLSDGENFSDDYNIPDILEKRGQEIYNKKNKATI